MTGWMTMVVWTVGTISVLAFLATVLKMTLDYRSRESQSRVKESQAMMESMREMVAQSSEVVRMQTQLTEVLLVGRPRPATEPPPEIGSPSVTLPTQDELFRDLPPNIREAMLREVEEEATWQSPSERPQEVSVPDDLGEMEEQLRASLSPFGSTWVPQPDGSNSG